MNPVRNRMKAIILAAGMGERMQPLTRNLPKTLVRVGSQPLIDHIFDSLPKRVTEVIVVIGYKGERVRQYLGDVYKGRKINYAVQENLNGTAGALRAAKMFLNPQDKKFLVFYGDELPSKREVKNVLLHQYSLLCHKITTPIETGVVVTDKQGRVIKISEKPKKLRLPILAAGGVMLLDKKIFNFKPTRHRNGEYYLTSMLSKFSKDHSLFAVIGSPDLYFTTASDVDKVNKKVYKNQ